MPDMKESLDPLEMFWGSSKYPLYWEVLRTHKRQVRGGLQDQSKEDRGLSDWVS